MKKILALIIISLVYMCAFAQNQKDIFDYNSGGKRDPFVAIVGSEGLRPKEELFSRPNIIEASDDTISQSIKLNAILWDKDKPLAVIGGKVHKEGQVIFENLKLEKIDKDRIIINNNGRLIEIKIGGRKNEGEK